MAKANKINAIQPDPSTPDTPAAKPGTGPGVIAALIDLLRQGGGTREELYAKLAERFPDRASEKGGMRTTVAIQLKRLHQQGKLAITSEQVEGRGTVYRAE
jgi:hypothetical protein